MLKMKPGQRPQRGSVQSQGMKIGSMPSLNIHLCGWREREREKERERPRQTQTDPDRPRETEGGKGREREIERDAERERDKEKQRETKRNKEKQRETKRNKEKETQRERYIYIWHLLLFCGLFLQVALARLSKDLPKEQTWTSATPAECPTISAVFKKHWYVPNHSCQYDARPKNRGIATHPYPKH